MNTLPHASKKAGTASAGSCLFLMLFLLRMVTTASGQSPSTSSTAQPAAGPATRLPTTPAASVNAATPPTASSTTPASPNLSESDFFRAIVEGRQRQITAYLSAGGKADAIDQGGYTALMSAIGCMRRQVAAELIRAGANVNHQARDGRTPLCLAVEMGSPGMVQDLLKAGADAKGSGRFIPLQNALQLGHTGITRMLLSAGADPNNLGTSKIAVSPLDQAMNIGAPPMARDLAKAGANLNTQSRTGDTALIHATMMTHPGMVKALLTAGADSTLRNNQGMTAQDIALTGNIPAVKAAFP